MAPVKREVKHEPKLEAKHEKTGSITPLTSPTAPRPGTSPQRFKMSDRDREIIIKMRLDGIKPVQIAETLGIKASTVSMFLLRKRKKAMNSMDPDMVQLLARSPLPKKRSNTTRRDK
ncbi:hypothetical protein [Sporisorium scitamineum]|nr:hypothetical protein [Sporisorium scitamineum]